MSPNSNPAYPAPAESSPVALIVAWLFVGIPLAWGVSQTFIKALALFN